MAEKDNGLSLPQMPVADYNRLMQSQFKGDSVEWVDANGDKQMQAAELQGKQDVVAKYVTVTGDEKRLSEFFRVRYASVLELFRQELVEKELKLTQMRQVIVDLDDWLQKNTTASAEQRQHYRSGVEELLKGGAWMERQYQIQVGHVPGDARFQPSTETDRLLVERYRHGFCMGNPTDLCTASPTFPPRESGVFYNGVTCEDASAMRKDGDDKGGLLSGENPFTVNVRAIDGSIMMVPYSVAFYREQSEAARHFERAAEYFKKIPRERAFASHLIELAKALRSPDPFPYVASDETWLAHGDSDSIFLFRAGADETGSDGVGDSCGIKARAHFRIGLINTGVLQLVDRYRNYLQSWEEKLARLVANPAAYSAHPVALKMPQFYDVVYEAGDDIGGPNGTPIGQTLPNWCGPNGMEEPCRRRIMIYVNKTEQAYSEDVMRQYVMPLFSSVHAKDFVTGDVALESVVLHEMGHNFGPGPGMERPGTGKPYEAHLGKWGSAFEELKAQTCSLYFAGELFKETRQKFRKGEIDKNALDAAEMRYRQHITYDLAWAVRMVLRGTRNSPTEVKGGSYSKLAAIQVGYLTEAGALSYDAKNKCWKINFEGDVFFKVVERLMEKVVQLYAYGSFDEVDKFASYFMAGGGFRFLHIDRIKEVAGNMPSTLFDYHIRFGRDELTSGNGISEK